MSITITLTDPGHVFGVEAAAAAASTPAIGENPAVVVTPQEYAQRVLEQAAESWARQFGYVAASIPLDRAMALGAERAAWNAWAAANGKPTFGDESALCVHVFANPDDLAAFKAA